MGFRYVGHTKDVIGRLMDLGHDEYFALEVQEAGSFWIDVFRFADPKKRVTRMQTPAVFHPVGITNYGFYRAYNYGYRRLILPDPWFPYGMLIDVQDDGTLDIELVTFPLIDVQDGVRYQLIGFGSMGDRVVALRTNAGFFPNNYLPIMEEAQIINGNYTLLNRWSVDGLSMDPIAGATDAKTWSRHTREADIHWDSKNGSYLIYAKGYWASFLGSDYWKGIARVPSGGNATDQIPMEPFSFGVSGSGINEGWYWTSPHPQGRVLRCLMHDSRAGGLGISEIDMDRPLTDWGMKPVSHHMGTGGPFFAAGQVDTRETPPRLAGAKFTDLGGTNGSRLDIWTENDGRGSLTVPIQTRFVGTGQTERGPEATWPVVSPDGKYIVLGVTRATTGRTAVVVKPDNFPPTVGRTTVRAHFS